MGTPRRRRCRRPVAFDPLRRQAVRLFPSLGESVVARRRSEQQEIVVRDREGYREMVARDRGTRREMVWSRARIEDPSRSGWPYVDLFHVAAGLAGRRERALFVGC